MHRLELCVPPVLVQLLCAMMMWISSRFLSNLTLVSHSNYPVVIFVVLLIIGNCLVFSAIFSILRAGTTINPFRPELSTRLVHTGVFRYSRNPIYLGLALMLLGWGIYLLNIVALLFVFVFVWYINYFQIIPEEKILLRLFGDQFKHYQLHVRRWL